MADRALPRRRLLLAAVGVPGVALAGCVGDEDPADDPDDEMNEDGDQEANTDENANDDRDGDEGQEDDSDDGMDDDPDEKPDDEPEGEYPGDLPSDPEDDDFVDMTGEDVVEIETREGVGDEPAFLFDPPFVRVEEGTTVRWVNADGVFHTVTSTPTLDRRSGGGDVFDAQISSEGATFEWTPDEPGRQDYYCSPHAGFMFGSIAVDGTNGGM